MAKQIFQQEKEERLKQNKERLKAEQEHQQKRILDTYS